MALILIVDDAAFSRRMIRKALQTDDYQILEATNKREGLEMASTHTPDLILTDLLMPDLHGFELLHAIQQQGLKKQQLLFQQISKNLHVNKACNWEPLDLLINLLQKNCVIQSNNLLIRVNCSCS